MHSYEASIDDDISERGPGALIIEIVSSADDALTRPGQDGRMRIFHVATRSGWDAAQEIKPQARACSNLREPGNVAPLAG